MPGRILLAVDDSKNAHKAADVVERFAKDIDADVTVLHLQEIALGSWGRLRVDEPAGDEFARDVAQRLNDAGVHATSVTREAYLREIAQGIIQVADDVDADFIAVGSRGLSDVGALAFGSVSHKLLHLSHRPVLVVPDR